MFENWPHAAMYLSATVSSYWKWSDNGQEIAWADGHALSFLPELTPVLERLARDGLPPLGSILLLLAACRNNWRDPPSRRGLLAGVLDAEHASNSRELLWEVCNGLDKIQTLPADLRSSTNAKAELAAMVFEGGPSRLNSEVSRSVVESLAQDWSGSSLRPSSAVTLSYWLVRDLGALRDGLRRVDEAALRLRLKTGLEALPAPAKIDPPPVTGRAWLAQLEQDQEFAGLARLAKRLLAVIHIPRHLHDADDLPVGGVTDIAPRGPLDRLLLSELAHDDLTLAVRVAMNEALYYRRESPPRTPPRQRHVLLDAGLRLWGLPRLYGTAVALAMTAHHDSHVEVQAHRAAGPELEPVAMNTAEGIRNHLAALDHRLHPGESLPALADLLKADAGGDAVLVTSDDTLADPAFQRALEQNLSGTLYLASVARDGRFELHQYSRAGRKRLSMAQLPLEEILKDRPTAAALRDNKKSPLPAIFNANPFPLLLSTQVDLENSWYVDGWGVLTLSRDGRLLFWDKPAHGARQLAAGLPQGVIHGVTPVVAAADRICLVIGRLSQHGLYALWVHKFGEVEKPIRLRTDEAHVAGVAVDRGVAYVRSHFSAQAVNLWTGQPFRPCAVPRGVPYNQLFVKESSASAPAWMMQWKWSRLTLQGGATELTSVLLSEPGHKEAPYLVVFECHGIEGPVAITKDGSIFLTGRQETKQVKHWLPLPLTVESVARDGTSFVLKSGTTRSRIFTSSGVVYQTRYEPLAVETEIHEFARPRPICHRFQHIGIERDGSLSLTSRRNAHWSLHVPSLTFHKESMTFPATPSIPLAIWEHEEVSGFGLKRAEFPDGSMAVLDSRGLLHLKSADANIPECTLVLCEGATAGWCSDGRMWGPSYYLGDRSPTRTEIIAHDVIKPFVERLR